MNNRNNIFKLNKLNNGVFFMISCLALLIVANLLAGEKEDFSLKSLDGNWEGKGTAMIPGTSMTMDIEGSARFEYFDKDEYLKTSIVAEKFMFTYRDTGHMVYDSESNIVTWEIWNNIKQYAKYKGVYKDSVISTTRKHRGKIYIARIEIKHVDSLVFELLESKTDADPVSRASILLVRQNASNPRD